MVSLWPWRGDSNSAEAFEKSLSTLATKITKTTAQNDSLRQRARKLKVSWTLYAGFAYILAALILTLVTGWKNWGPVEYTVISGGPVVWYGVRKLLTLYYDYRVSKNQEYLDSLNKERDTTIDKLKAATKYNSTQELIDKYSSKPATPKQQAGDGKKRLSSGQQRQGPQQQRVFVQPPATANINRGPVPKPGTPVQQQSGTSPPRQNLPQLPPKPLPPSPGIPPSAEFAPNAFPSPPTNPSAPAFGESRWYDRILDALLGEDETSSKNRFALICSQCRLVNGQAPPGAKSLEDVGIWRCSGCGVMNGEESEATKLVKHVTQVVKSEPSEPEVGEEFAPSASDEASEDSPSPEDETPARSTRSKSKGRKGKKKT